jgi:hypothetical protein
MVRLIKRPPLSVEGRRKKGVVRPSPRYVTKAAYPYLRGMYVRYGTKHVIAPRKRRTS